MVYYADTLGGVRKVRNEQPNADKKILTIITPSYNRAHTLPNVYDSLKNQTSKYFVWLVVDDGSSDNTEELVNGFIEEAVIDIEYLKKPNGGKGSALNLGLDNLHTELVTCLDSDDLLYKTAVEDVIHHYERIKNDNQCCGIIAFRSNPDGTPMGGKKIPSDWKKATAADIFLSLRSKGEVICFYKKAVIEKLRFPTFPGENFFSPAWMQYEATRNYYFSPSNSVLCICEYLEDGLTKNVRSICAKNPNCYRCVKKQSFELSKTIKTKIKHGIMYDCSCIMSRYSNWLQESPHKMLSLVLMPAAYVVYLKWFKKFYRDR